MSSLLPAKIMYSPRGDVLYLYMVSSPSVAKSRNVSDDVVLDFDETGRLVGIEVLGFMAGQDISGLIAELGLHPRVMEILGDVKKLISTASVREELVLA